MTLSRKAVLQPMSEKRRAKLAAAGVLHPSSTLTAADKPKPGKRKPRRPDSTGPDQATVNAVLARDEWSCVSCGGVLHGTRGLDWSIQHRRPRGNGGSSRPDRNAPQNLLSVCGSATTSCHQRMESQRVEARRNGWLVPLNGDPLTVPVLHAIHGFIYLTADGGWTDRRPHPLTEGSINHG